MLIGFSCGAIPKKSAIRMIMINPKVGLRLVYAGSTRA